MIRSFPKYFHIKYIEKKYFCPAGAIFFFFQNQNGKGRSQTAQQSRKNEAKIKIIYAEIWPTYSCLVAGTRQKLAKIEAVKARDRPCRMREKKA